MKQFYRDDENLSTFNYGGPGCTPKMDAQATSTSVLPTIQLSLTVPSIISQSDILRILVFVAAIVFITTFLSIMALSALEVYQTSSVQRKRSRE